MWIYLFALFSAVWGHCWQYPLYGGNDIPSDLWGFHYFQFQPDRKDVPVRTVGLREKAYFALGDTLEFDQYGKALMPDTGASQPQIQPMLPPNNGVANKILPNASVWEWEKDMIFILPPGYRVTDYWLACLMSYNRSFHWDEFGIRVVTTELEVYRNSCVVFVDMESGEKPLMNLHPPGGKPVPHKDKGPEKEEEGRPLYEYFLPPLLVIILLFVGWLVYSQWRDRRARTLSVPHWDN